MARINANYEKDRAALAKTDPAFMAKNQFFDVGHAEGSGDDLDRNVFKNITKGLINGEIDKVNNS